MGAASYERLRVRLRQELANDRVPFWAVENEIQRSRLATDAKAALWLYAWSLRDQGVQVREAEEISKDLAPIE